MGRNKIKIKKIDSVRDRKITFYKRRKGLFKKAMELSLLCDSKVLLIVTSEDNNSSSVYCSDGGNKNNIKKYFNAVMSQELKHNYTNLDYNKIGTKEADLETNNSGDECEDGKTKKKDFLKPLTRKNPKATYEEDEIDLVEKCEETNSYAEEDDEYSLKDVKFLKRERNRGSKKKACNPLKQPAETISLSNSLKKDNNIPSKCIALPVKANPKIEIIKNPNSRGLNEMNLLFNRYELDQRGLSYAGSTDEVLNTNSASYCEDDCMKVDSFPRMNSNITRLNAKLGLKVNIPKEQKEESPEDFSRKEKISTFTNNLSTAPTNENPKIGATVSFQPQLNSYQNNYFGSNYPKSSSLHNLPYFQGNYLKKEGTFASSAFSPISPGNFLRPVSPFQNSVPGTPNTQICFNFSNQNVYNTFINVKDPGELKQTQVSNQQQASSPFSFPPASASGKNEKENIIKTWLENVGSPNKITLLVNNPTSQSSQSSINQK